MKLLVLDGNSIFNRAFYGIKLLTTKSGVYTNAIYGFLTMLNKLTDEIAPDAVAIAFDMKAPTFRHKAYDGYKATRKGMPEELAAQFPVLKELLSAMGYKLVEKEGYEADDILGTLADTCEKSGETCIIATGDRDSLQLVSKNVSVRIAATKFGRPEVTLYDEDKIREVYGVEPRQLIDIKAIQGDASDNIPGVAGIGEKGAGELIRNFGSLEHIYDNIDSLDIKEGTRKKLLASKDNAFLSKFLGTIVKDVPIDVDLQSYTPQEMDKAKVAKMLTELEMFSLLNKFGLEQTNEEITSEDKTVKVVVNEATNMLEKLIRAQKSIGFLYENKELKLKRIGLYLNDTVYILDNLDSYKDLLKSIMEDEQIEKKTYDIKTFYEIMHNLNIDVKGVKLDVLLAAYLLNPSSKNYNLETLIQEYAVNKVKINNDLLEDDAFVQNAAAFSDLCCTIEGEIKKNSQKYLLESVEIPLAKVLAEMEQVGFLVDAEGIKNYGDALAEEMQTIQGEVFELVGHEFNINSPKQLGEILFEELKLPKGKKTKSGYSTSAEVLEGLRGVHPAVDAVLQYRALAKLKSTYCDGLLKVVDCDGRIHSRFNQVEARTGRISSLEPNLQNIPVRTERGKELRKFFRAREGWMLVDADYSQIELRILAHLADDKNMIEAFKNGLDIHTQTAAQVFNIPENMVTPLMRSRAKAVNFGIVYGIGAFSLAKDIGVTRKEAQAYIDSYLAHYAGVERYMRETIEAAKENKFVDTIFGRRRYLPELASSNFNLRAFGERVARNMPIQGSAADIIKIAMINVSRRLREENLNARLILQVHDELIVEAPEAETIAVANILKVEMENAAKLNVPLVADANIGKTWFDAKS